MAIKIVIGCKSGKCYQKELESNEAEALQGRKLGEEITGDAIGFPGANLLITGGSDASGFPMRRDLPGTQKKKILTVKSTGFRGKLRGKRFDGLKIKKTVAGNTIHNKTNQINLKVLKGDSVVEKAFAPAEEPAEGTPKAEE